MNENENLKPIEKLTPFTKMVMSIGTLPSSFYASMSYYESMVWLYEYLKNQVIPTVNNNAEAVEELQAKFIELKTFIDEYFENLDVQQEINNKLDEMAEDGSLTNLIKQYIDPLYQAYEEEINTEIDNQNTTITNFINSTNKTIDIIDNKVNTATSGSPKAVYATLSDLQTANPDHNYIYLVLADGKWYYYSTTNNAWNEGGVYQSTGLGTEEVEALNLSNSLKKELLIRIPSYEIVNGEYYNNVAKYENASFCRTTPIQVYEGETIRVKAQGYSTYMNIITMVDANADVITDIPLRVKSIDSNLNYYELKVPKNCYVSLCTSVNNLFQDLIIIKDINAIINDLLNPNILNNLSSGYIRSNGVITENHAFYLLTDYIKISPNNKYTLKYLNFSTTDNVGLCFYDINKKYISGIQYTATTDLEFTSPENAYFIRATLINDLSNSDFDKMKLENYNTVYENIRDVIYNSNNKINRSIGMFNKLVMYGDSLTRGLTYTSSTDSYINYFDILHFLSSLIHSTDNKKIAFGGAKTDTWWAANSGNITDNNSLCVLWFGTNDTFTDTVATDCAGDDYTTYATTETGYYGKIIRKLKDQGGNIIILLTQFANNAQKTLNNKVINDLASKFNCYIIDVNNTEIHKQIYHTAYNGYYNNVHFNNLGNNYVANLISNGINEILMNNTMEIYKVQ